MASDYLSFGDPDFDPIFNRRSAPFDSWEILADGNTIEFDLRAVNNVDEARVMAASALGDAQALLILLGDANLDDEVTFLDIAHSLHFCPIKGFRSKRILMVMKR